MSYFNFLINSNNIWLLERKGVVEEENLFFFDYFYGLVFFFIFD